MNNKKNQLVFTSEKQIQQVENKILKSFPRLYFDWTISQKDTYNKFKLARDNYRKRVQSTPTLREEIVGVSLAIVTAPLALMFCFGPIGLLVLTGAISAAEDPYKT